MRNQKLIINRNGSSLIKEFKYKVKKIKKYKFILYKKKTIYQIHLNKNKKYLYKLKYVYNIKYFSI